MTTSSTVPSARDETSDNTSLVPRDFRSTLAVLLVDDERSLLETCRTILVHLGYRVDTANKGDDALRMIERKHYDIVITDLYLPSVTGIDVCKAAMARSHDTLVLVMTGKPSVSSNVSVLQEGAWDYLPKPFSATQFEILVGRAAHTILVARESAAGAIAPTGDDAPLGSAASFLKCLEVARRVAATDASVFISGETGSGKEMIAQYIHRRSRRSGRPLVAINCAAMPEGLLESEMFGHVKGSFTGAVRDKPGLLETANGGTMFLDELTEMPKPLQAKLLRVIQDGVVRRVGASGVSAVVNVRFIAASNRNPATAVKDGTLREDLYYRLRVVPIMIPPLRERPDDIVLLAHHFLRRFWRQHRGATRAVPTLAEDAIAALQAHAWPGNVRELQNLIEHSVVLLPDTHELRASALQLQQDGSAAFPSGRTGPGGPGGLLAESYHAARDRIIAEFERQYIDELATAAAGNMSKAARIAGVDRTTLYRLMERHGLHRESVVSAPRA